jgi:hypothetical protein
MLTVTSLADSGAGSLRSLVVQANSDSSFAGQGDTIQFAPYLSGTITLGTPLALNSVQGVEIDGSPTVTLSGGGTSQVFQVEAGTSAVLKGLTITNGWAAYGGAILNFGSLTLNGDILSGNAASLQGGAIANGGSLTLNGDVLSNNAAYYNGGAIYNQGDLAVNASTLSKNVAFLSGGGICNDGGGVVLDASTLSINVAYDQGGGLYNGTGNVWVQDNCNLSGNFATYDGGAIYNSGSGSANLWISGGILWGNTAAQNGGAIDNEGAASVQGANLSYNAAGYESYAGYGGAVYNNPVNGQLTLSSDWLAYNTAAYGGAVYNSGGTMTMSGNVVTANTAVQGGGVYNFLGSLTMMGDNVSSNYLRLPTASDPDPNAQPLGSGLYNFPGSGTVSLDGNTFIGNNVNPDGSLGGDIYGV